MSTYLDHYPDCVGCPHTKYCGLMVGSIRLCNSYDMNHKEKETTTTSPDEEQYYKEMEAVFG